MPVERLDVVARQHRANEAAADAGRALDRRRRVLTAAEDEEPTLRKRFEGVLEICPSAAEVGSAVHYAELVYCPIVMTDSLAAVRSALRVFHDDAQGCCIRCSLFDVAFNTGVWLPNPYSAARGITSKLQHHLCNAALLVGRLEWTRAISAKGELPEHAWRAFSQIDLDSFFIQMRSTMDHCAKLIDAFSPKPGQLAHSFKKLRTMAEDRAVRFPAGTAELVESTNWFADLRTVRDALVHDGARTLVFCSPAEGLLFQIHGNQHRRLLSRAIFMRDENIVRFDRFIAWAFGHLLDFLNSLGDALSKIWQPEPWISPVSSYCFGFSQIRAWMNDAVMAESGADFNNPIVA